MLYKVYAENVIDAMSGIKNRRFIANCEGTNTGAGIFDLYADECGDEEEIVIVPADAEAMGHKGGSVKSPAKSDAAITRNAKRKAEGKPEGGRPRKLTSP